MSADVISYLKHKELRITIKPMYKNINMLSDIFRKHDFKPEMKLLSDFYEKFESFVKELETHDWDQKKVPKETIVELNKLMNEISYRSKLRKMEYGLK